MQKSNLKTLKQCKCFYISARLCKHVQGSLVLHERRKGKHKKIVSTQAMGYVCIWIGDENRWKMDSRQNIKSYDCRVVIILLLLLKVLGHSFFRKESIEVCLPSSYASFSAEKLLRKICVGF